MPDRTFSLEGEISRNNPRRWISASANESFVGLGVRLNAAYQDSFISPRLLKPIRRATFLLVAATVFVAPSHAQNTIHVPTDQPSIQQVINAASNGDTVPVAPGTYNETSTSRAKPSRSPVERRVSPIYGMRARPSGWWESRFALWEQRPGREDGRTKEGSAFADPFRLFRS